MGPRCFARLLRACEEFNNGGYSPSDHQNQYTIHPSTDNVVIATATAVLEPATWGLMIVGFGLIVSH